MHRAAPPAVSAASVRGPRLRRALVGVAAAALVATGTAPALAAHTTVTAVKGSAFGHHLSVGLFGGPPNVRGPSPTVTLAADASNSPLSASTPSSSAVVGPATFFSSGATTVTIQGSMGVNGSVTSTATIQNVNASGQESLTAATLASTCTATKSGRSASTSITNGTLYTDSGEDLNDNGNFTDPGDHPPVTVNLPSSPAPGLSFEGHIHVNDAVDNFRYVFNEQVVAADGSLTVYAAHEYLVGPTAVGDLWLGKSECGVTTQVAVNSPPVANDDSYSTPADTPLVVTAAQGVLANDTDADGEALTAEMPSDPPNGTVVLSPSGSFTYTPDAGFAGTDSFTYMVHDTHNAMDTGSVSITVQSTTPVNTPPNAADDSYATPFNTALVVADPGVLGNDSDADGDPLAIISSTPASNGSLTVGGDGSVLYTPNAGYTGNDGFLYTVSDGQGGTDSASVVIAVGAPPATTADVSVGATGPATLDTLATGTYTITITNAGPDTATGVTSQTILAGTRASIALVSSGVATCATLKGKVKGVTCTVGNLDAGQPVTVTVDVTAPRKAGAMSLDSSVSTTSTDTNTANNSFSLPVNIVKPA